MKIYQVKYKSSFSGWKYVYFKAETPEVTRETVFYESFVDCRENKGNFVDKFESSKIYEAIKKMN